MRTLTTQDLSQVSGGEITQIYFDLKPGIEVIGVEQILLGYDTVSWIEPGFWTDRYYEIQTPIYTYIPIYAETVTFYY